MVLFMTHYTVSIALKDSCWNNSQKVIRLLLVSYVECTDVPISAITAYRDMKGFICYCTGQDTCSCFCSWKVIVYIQCKNHCKCVK